MKLFARVTMLFSMVFITTLLFGQEKCAFDHFHQLQKDQYGESVVDSMNQLIRDKVSFSGFQTKAAGDIYKIPVVVHVIHKGEAVGMGTNISDAQIESAINNLTDVYRNTLSTATSVDTKIEFQLAVRDPDCNVTNGIVRVDGSVVPGYAANGVSAGGPGVSDQLVKDLSKWPTDRYMNFWIVTEIDNNNGGFGVQGYANFPNPDPYNGAVMMASIFGYSSTNNSEGFNLNMPYNNGTAVHEVGHFLTLFHTFQDGGPENSTTCPPNANPATQGDECPDTDPHIVSTSTCFENNVNPCAAPNLLGNVIHNWMSYASCQYEFTNDQKARMRACLETSRSGLISSLGLVPVTTVFTPPIAPSCVPNTTGSGNGGIENVTFAGINSTSNGASGDNGYVDNTASCLQVATVELNQTYPMSITNWLNSQYIKVWIDYDNSSTFEATELVFDQTLTGSSEVGTGNVTIPATATTNTYIRMRVLSEWTPLGVPNSCSSLQVGQAEDYTVFITDPGGTTPVAAFSADLTTACANTDITFTDASTNTPTSWAWAISPATGWSYASGSTATSQNPVINFTDAGSYQVTLTATNSSGSDDEIKVNYININALPVISGFTETNPTCGSDGSTTVNATGAATLTYAWLPGGETTPMLSNIGGGTYNVTVTDGNTCMATGASTLANPPGAPTITLTPTNATCGLSNGQAVVSITGNTGTPTYVWSTSSNTSDTETALAVGGPYTLSINVDGCNYTESYSITAVSPPTLTVTENNATCGQNNGSLEAVVTGNTGTPTYSWSVGGSNATLPNLGAATETVTVMVDGCTLTETGTVTALASPTLTVTENNATCGQNNGSLEAVVSGNTGVPTYTWTSGGNSATETGLGAVTETVTVNVDGCTLTQSGTVTALAAPTVVVNATDASCGMDNGSLEAVVSGNTGAPTYAWTNGVTTALNNNLGTVTETVTVTVDGCTLTESGTVTPSPTSPSVVVNATDATCGQNNGSLEAVVSGNTGVPTYTWTSGGNSATETGLGAVTETVTITVDGCTLTESGTVNTVATPTVVVNATDASCGMDNGSLEAVVSGNTGAPTYAWTNGVTTALNNNLGTVTETVTVTVDGCTLTESGTVASTPGPSLTFSATNASCGLDNGELTANVSGAVGTPVFNWSNTETTATISNLSPGAYTLDMSVDGCVYNETISIMAVAIPTLTINVTDASCGLDNGMLEAVVANGVGTPSFAWSNMDLTATTSNLADGVYTVGVMIDGCTLTESATVTDLAVPTLTASATATTCGLENGAAAATVSGATTVTYTWSNGANGALLANVIAGDYTVNVDADGCALTEMVTIDPSVATDPGVLNGATTSCLHISPGFYEVSAYNGVVSDWVISTDNMNWTSLAITEDTLTAAAINTVTWLGVVSNLANCPSDTAFIMIDTLLTPIVDAGPDQAVDINTTTFLDGVTSENNYVWMPYTPLDDSSLLAPLVTVSNELDTMFILSAIGQNGCVGRDTMYIDVLTAWDYLSGVHVPNAFSPNGDNNNDILDLFVGDDVQSFDFIIFNRWGEIMFRTDTKQNLWDGNYKGMQVNDGVYAYKLTVKYYSKPEELKEGNITVIH